MLLTPAFLTASVPEGADSVSCSASRGGRVQMMSGLTVVVVRRVVKTISVVVVVCRPSHVSREAVSSVRSWPERSAGAAHLMGERGELEVGVGSWRW